MTPKISKHDVVRTIRISRHDWDAAMAKATERGESLSEVIREALRRYVEGTDR